MVKKPNSILLNLCFCAFALIMLSACGGGGGAGDEGGIAEPEGKVCDTNPDLPICEAATVECDPIAQFCDSTKASRADCNPRSHDCGDRNSDDLFQGTGAALACNDLDYFCGDGEAGKDGVTRVACDPRNTNCGDNGDGLPSDCNDYDKFCGTLDEIVRADCDANNANTDNNIYNCEDGERTCDNSVNFCHSTKAPRESCDPNSHDCGEDNQGTGALLNCNNNLNFCDSPEQIVRATCDIATHDCEGTGGGTGVRTCDPATHFCGSPEKIEIATCNPATHNCGNNGDGTGERTCDPSTHFCFTSGIEKATCNIATHECEGTGDGTGVQTCDPETHFCFTSGIAKATCNIATHNCGNNGDGTGERTCDPSTHFCFTSKIAKDTCNIATHECEGTGDGTGVQTCDNNEKFCFTTKALRADCVPETHNCGNNGDGTGELTCDNSLKWCFTDDQIVRATCNALLFNCDDGVRLPCDASLLIKDCDTGKYNTGTRDIATGYLPPDTEEPPTGGWDATLAAIRASAEYHATRAPTPGAFPTEYSAADQIGAAYAHARGYSGEGVIVSIMVGEINREHADLDGALVRGYANDRLPQHDEAGQHLFTGTCLEEEPAIKNLAEYQYQCSDEIYSPSTHIAGIIAGRKDGSGIQGIAYNAKIKPIASDAINNLIYAEDAEDAEAYRTSGTIGDIISGTDTFTGLPIAALQFTVAPTSLQGRLSLYDGGEDESLFREWIKITQNTVIVAGNSDHGQNTENGTTRTLNQGAPLARLPLIVSQIQDKWLTVIALDNLNVIAPSSNGCGDAKAFCLGAPGVNIYTTLARGGYGARSSTDVAAAHVSGAVAILKSAFPKLTPAEIVSIILETADPLGVGGITNTPDDVYGHGALNLARATEPIGDMTMTESGNQGLEAGITIDNSGVTLPASFGGALTDLTAGFTDDYDRAFIGFPERIAQQNIAFTLDETMATWESPELQSIALDSNSKMQFTNYDDDSDAKDTLMFTHNLPNHTVAFSYNEEHKTPDLMLAGAGNTGDEMHFQKILPIAKDLMQLNSTYKLGKAWSVKNAITSGEFDTGNRFNEAMANLNYTGENHNLTIGAGTLKEYGQFLGASGTGAYQLSDATQSTITHLAVSQNLPLNSSVKVKYTNFKTEVDMRYDNFANINDLTADEYQLSLSKKQLFGKNDSLNFELIQPFAVTDGTLQQNTVLGYNAEGGYNNVTQNFDLAPTNRRQQLRMTWQNLVNLKNETKLFLSVQYDRHVGNLRDKEDSQILGGISTRF